MLIERTKIGLEAAKKRGRVGGRNRVMTPSKFKAAKKLLAEGMPPKEITQNLGVENSAMSMNNKRLTCQCSEIEPAEPF